MGINTAQVFAGHCAIFDSFTLNNLDTVSLSANAEEIMRRAAGGQGPAFVGTAAGAPTVQLTSRDLHEILTACSPTNAAQGLVISTQAKIQFRKRATSNNEHVNATSVSGFLHVSDFGAKQGDKEGADCNLIYTPLLSGANVPLLFNTAQAISGSLAVNSLYALGPVMFEGTQLRMVQETRVNTGFKVAQKASDGLVFPDLLTVDEFAYTATVTGNNLEFAGQMPQLGRSYPITNGIVLYYQKCKPGADRFAYTDAVHIKVTFPAGSYVLEEVAVQGSNDATKRLKVNATTVPTIALSQQISVS